MKRVLFFSLLLAVGIFFKKDIMSYFCSPDIIKESIPSCNGKLIADDVRLRHFPSRQAAYKIELKENDEISSSSRTVGDSSFTTKKRGLMKDHWYFVKTVTGDTGWVFGAYIQWYPKQEMPVAVASTEVINLPSSPTIERDQVSSLAATDFWGTPKYTSTELKEIIEASDYANEIVRNKAVEVASARGASGVFNLAQVCNIYDYCYRNWKYINDPSAQDYVAKASESILNKRTGDCDDFAVLMATMLTSIGGHPRINYAYGSRGGHAFTEVCLGSSINMSEIKGYISARYQVADATIYFRKDGAGRHWLNMDWMGYGVQRPGAEYYSFTTGTSYYILEQNQIGFDPSATIHTDAELISDDILD
jgi:hypothetical protein